MADRKSKGLGCTDDNFREIETLMQGHGNFAMPPAAQA
jgi:hypothetical protein